MKMKLASCLIAALAFSNAHAASVQNTTGIVSPATTITFDEVVLADSSLVTTEYSGLGVTFSSLYYNSQGPATLPGISGNYVGNNVSGPLLNPFSIFFSSDVTSAAFGVATNPGLSTFEAWNGGLFVESFSASTSFDGSTDYYFGFTGITFDEIRVSVGGDGQMLIDNLQVTAVPEPETYAMLLAGLGLLGFMARRRKESAV